ncbi:hypothetical protein BKA82DRAFT_4016862 [Pisolithus tinctorius]|nr:hypothetical protein BKA82DRAFT_4016860 [Pisolithus tinctorius]KAI6144722.1 hypothetical protein BKA82DRAFT_4016862 [Pisolithus tinctorius]
MPMFPLTLCWSLAAPFVCKVVQCTEGKNIPHLQVLDEVENVIQVNCVAVDTMCNVVCQFLHNVIGDNLAVYGPVPQEMVDGVPIVHGSSSKTINVATSVITTLSPMMDTLRSSCTKCSIFASKTSWNGNRLPPGKSGSSTHILQGMDEAFLLLEGVIGILVRPVRVHFFPDLEITGRGPNRQIKLSNNSIPNTLQYSLGE